MCPFFPIKCVEVPNALQAYLGCSLRVTTATFQLCSDVGTWSMVGRWSVFPTLKRFNDRAELDFHWIKRFPWSICDGCGMQAGSACPFGHLVPSLLSGFACASIAKTRFLKHTVSYSTFNLQYPRHCLEFALINFKYVQFWQQNCCFKLQGFCKLYDVPVGFEPPPLFWGWILLILQSPKGGYCSISDDLSCSFKPD